VGHLGHAHSSQHHLQLRAMRHITVNEEESCVCLTESSWGGVVMYCLTTSCSAWRSPSRGPAASASAAAPTPSSATARSASSSAAAARACAPCVTTRTFLGHVALRGEERSVSSILFKRRILRSARRNRRWMDRTVCRIFLKVSEKTRRIF